MTKLKLWIMSLSKMKLRIISGILLILSFVLGFFSRYSIYDENMMTRVAIYPGETYTSAYSYIWELLGVAILLFITALSLLIISFKKLNK
jgi:hypothetical protein